VDGQAGRKHQVIDRAVSEEDERGDRGNGGQDVQAASGIRISRPGEDASRFEKVLKRFAS
jgi:hypothetical protein